MRSHTYNTFFTVLSSVPSKSLFLLEKNKRTKVFYIQTLTEAELSTAYAHTYPQASYPQVIHSVYTGDLYTVLSTQLYTVESTVVHSVYTAYT